MNWKKIWVILRPVATLGISLLIDLITKTDTPANIIVNKAVQAGGNLLIEEVDTAVNNTSDIDFKNKPTLPEVDPGMADKTK